MSCKKFSHVLFLNAPLSPFSINKPMKKVFVFFLLFVFVQGLFAQNERPKTGFDFAKYGIKIEPEKRLIVVMAALDAGGLETELTRAGVGFRKSLREDLKDLKKETRDKLKIFIDQYKRRHPKDSPNELAAPFISLAYALGPVPELSDPKKVDDLPGDLLEVFDFAPLVREFYRNSGIELKMSQYVKNYEAVGDSLSRSAIQMTLELCDYLHTRPQLTYFERVVTKTKLKGKTLSKTEVREKERRFFIIPDLLTPIKTINFRNVGDDYFAIVPPNTNLLSSEVRRAYLQFIADSLVSENVKDISPHKDSIKILLEDLRQKTFQREKVKNPKLSIDDVYISPDIFLAVSRSFVAAADIKESEFRKIQIATFKAREKIDIAKTITDKKAVYNDLNDITKKITDASALQLSESYEKGAVLAFYFATQFKGLEESGFDVASSFRDMIQSLDATKEQSSLAQFAEARIRGFNAREIRRKLYREQLENQAATLDSEKEYFDKIGEVEEMIDLNAFDRADDRLIQLLDEYPSDARLFYMRGKVASASAEGIFDQTLLDEKLGIAATFYRNAILSATPTTNPGMLSKAHVSLGNILEFNEQPELALKEFEEAIKLGSSHNSYQEAIEGRNRLKKKN